jgi:thiamine-phosphate pyrophosphorylase
MRRIPRLCLVTDRDATKGRDLLAVVEAGLAGGVDAVQLRVKDLAAKPLCELALALRDLCRRYDASLLVNDRVDIALSVGADGVQLPENSFTAAEARRLLGPHPLIGVSRHRVGDLSVAQLAGADFVVFGPVFETPSKRAYGPPVGLDSLARAVAASPLPVLAIGGISVERVPDVLATGAYGVAVVRALLSADDPAGEAQALRRLLLG